MEHCVQSKLYRTVGDLRRTAYLFKGKLYGTVRDAHSHRRCSTGVFSRHGQLLWTTGTLFQSKLSNIEKGWRVLLFNQFNVLFHFRDKDGVSLVECMYLEFVACQVELS